MIGLATGREIAMSLTLNRVQKLTTNWRFLGDFFYDMVTGESKRHNLLMVSPALKK